MTNFFTGFATITHSLWGISAPIVERAPSPVTFVTYSAVVAGFAYLHRQVSEQKHTIFQLTQDLNTEKNATKNLQEDLRTLRTDLSTHQTSYANSIGLLINCDTILQNELNTLKNSLDTYRQHVESLKIEFADFRQASPKLKTAKSTTAPTPKQSQFSPHESEITPKEAMFFLSNLGKGNTSSTAYTNPSLGLKLIPRLPLNGASNYMYRGDSKLFVTTTTSVAVSPNTLQGESYETPTHTPVNPFMD